VMVWFFCRENELVRVVKEGGGGKTAKLVAAVNTLRHAGKEKALDALRGYTVANRGGGGEHVRVMLVCLFPDQEFQAALGQPHPYSLTEEAMRKSGFPVMLSRGVPFVVMRGYSMGGKPTPAGRMIEACRGFTMLKEDLPVTGHLEAAQALVDSAEFKAMFSDADDAKEMGEYVLEQAR
jgi:hypothetical protein